MGAQSAAPSGLENQISALDTYFDKFAPPCCDLIGQSHYDDIPDLDLWDTTLTWFQRIKFCLFFDFGKISRMCAWYCTPFDRFFGWSKVADAVVDFFKLCGNPELFNDACVVSCVPYFAICYLIYMPLWLPCFSCLAVSQVIRKYRHSFTNRAGRFVVNSLYLLSASIALCFRSFINSVCPGRTCFGVRKGCGPECSQVHRGGRFYTNYGLKNDGYEDYCFICHQGWDSHSGIQASTHALVPDH
jgi:hypothetical protein